MLLRSQVATTRLTSGKNAIEHTLLETPERRAFCQKIDGENLSRESIVQKGVHQPSHRPFRR
jgi:hypothetical protein